MTHLQHAQPVLVRPPAARARAAVRPRRRPAARLGRAGRRLAARAPARWPARRCRWTRAAVADGAGLRRRRAPTRSTPSSDRDFVAEFLFVARCSACTCPGSARRSCLWATREFGWVELDDAFATGSSIMPQKKNPDVAELARGKAGRLDRQPDRRCWRRSRACRSPTTATCRRTRSRSSTRSTRCCCVLPAVAGMVATMTCRRRPAWRPRRRTGFALATDVAEWLVRRGVPFREAHEVGRAAACALVRGATACELRDARRRRARRDLPARSTPGRARRCSPCAGALAARSGVRRHRPGPRSASSSPTLRAGSRATRRRGPQAERASSVRPPAGRCAAVFDRPVLAVAPELLGCRVSTHGAVAVRLTEVEAYDGRARPRLARLPRAHPAQRGDVRPGRARLRLLHLRHALVPERGLRTGRDRPPPCCCAPARWSRGSTSPRAPSRRATRRRAGPRPGPADLALGVDGPSRRATCSTRRPAAPAAAGRRTSPPAPSGTARGSGVPGRRGPPWRFWLDGEPTVSPYRAARAGARRGSTICAMTAARRLDAGPDDPAARPRRPAVARADRAVSTDLDALRAALDAGPVTFYCGFDPTAPSLHIGNLVQLLTLRRLQQRRAPAARPGRRCDRADRRPEAERRAHAQRPGRRGRVGRRGSAAQVEPFLAFDGGRPRRSWSNNLDWTAPLSAIDFLRDVGKHFRGQPDARQGGRERPAGVRGRHQLHRVQLPDPAGASTSSSCYRRHGCTLQIGGSDQWGNITAGLDLIRRVERVSVARAGHAAGHQGRRHQVRQDRAAARLARPGADVAVRLLPVLAQHRRPRRRPLPAALHLPRPRGDRGARDARPRSGPPPARRSARWPQELTTPGARRASRHAAGRGGEPGAVRPGRAGRARPGDAARPRCGGAARPVGSPAATVADLLVATGLAPAGRAGPAGRRARAGPTSTTRAVSDADADRRHRRTCCTARWLVLRRGQAQRRRGGVSATAAPDLTRI